MTESTKYGSVIIYEEPNKNGIYEEKTPPNFNSNNTKSEDKETMCQIILGSGSRDSIDSLDSLDSKCSNESVGYYMLCTIS
jgi:hypothetical protein